MIVNRDKGFTFNGHFFAEKTHLSQLLLQSSVSLTGGKVNDKVNNGLIIS